MFSRTAQPTEIVLSGGIKGGITGFVNLVDVIGLVSSRGKEEKTASSREKEGKLEHW